jgi:hypothetical protein
MHPTNDPGTSGAEGVAEEVKYSGPPPLGQRVLLHQMYAGDPTCCWCGAAVAGWLVTTCHPGLASGPLRLGSCLTLPA